MPDSRQEPLRLLTITQVAARLDLPVSIIRRWVRIGLLPSLRIRPGDVRIDPIEVRRFVHALAWLRAAMRLSRASAPPPTKRRA
jgi:excisionase family DNA binding protein